MDKQLFDEVIGEVPPATFDVAGLVTRGRRAVRVRRVVNPAVAAGLAVLLLSGAVVFSMSRDGGGPARVGGPPATSTTTTESTSETPVREPKAPAACANPDVESPAEAVARLSPAAKALVAAARPELRLSPNMSGNGRGPLDFGHDAPTQGPGQTVCEQFGSFVAAATTEGPEGAGNIIISMGPVYYERTGSCEEFLESHEPYCEVATGPNGEIIVKHTAVAENGVTIKMVDIVRPEGTSLHLSTENVATSVKMEDDPTATQPPLTHDQLVTIGTDPAMTLFP